jgi:transposase-like protein
MTSKTTNKFSPEVRARAVRMVLDHEKRSRIALGCGGVDRGEDRLRGADAATSG